MGHGAKRLEEVAGGAHGAGHHDGAAGPVGHLPEQRGAQAVDLAHPALGAMQLQAVGGAAEGVGQDQVAAGRDEGLVVRPDLVRLLLVPQVRRLAGGEPAREEAGAGGTVRQQPGPLGQQGEEEVVHGVRLHEGVVRGL